MIIKEKIDEDRELAITYLKEMQETYIEGDGYERHPLPEYYAIETALEALKQENCEDCVSREKAIAIGEKLFMLPLETEEDVEDAFEYFKRQIKDLPPVTPTGYKMKPVEQETCEDAISRQAVLDEMNIRRDNGDMITAGFIKGLPPIRLKAKVGKWKYYQNKKGNWINECSVCKCDAGVGYQYKYCPNCGSEMKEG